MLTIGQSISKTDLLQRAKDFQVQTSSNSAMPYQRELKAENDAFVARLQDAPDGSLADIKACALECSAKLSRKASIASFAGMGMMIGAWMAPIPGPAKWAAVIGGFALQQFVAGPAARQAEDKREFAGQLGEWQRAIDASSTQQPAPAPAPPSQNAA